MTATPDTLPIMPPVTADAIPQALRDIPHWLAWRYEWVEERDEPTKVPYIAGLNLRKASSTNPKTWRTFADVMQHHRNDPEQFGIGFAITPALGLVGLDLDHAIDPFTGEISASAQAIIDRMGSYTEVSPSGEGLRIWVYAALPDGGRRRGFLEMYNSGRYLTVTGAHLAGTPATIERRDDELAALHAEWFAKEEAEEMPTRREAVSVDMDDAHLLDRIRKARNGAAFVAMFDRGDTSGHGGDDSAADLALCNYLAYYTGRDAARMDRLFRASALWRPKWDKPHSGDGRTYGQMTIDQACKDTHNVYDPQGYRERQQPRQRAQEPATGDESNPLDSLRKDALVIENNTVNHEKSTEKGDKYNARRVFDIAADMEGIVGKWPRRLSSLLFVHEGDDIRYLEKPAHLFAWMAQRAEVSWRSGMGANNRTFLKPEEFHAYLQAMAPNYENIAKLPHEPRMAGYYYAWDPLPDYVPTGEYLDTLVKFFANVETPHDADLIKAMFCTPFWGGTLGRRPIFALAAPDKGYGKSTLAQHVGTLAGGFIEFRSGQRAEDDFVARLLTPSEQHKRVVRYDNIKGEFHSATVEGIITSPYISGKRMYTGEAVRPNDLTWVITGNGLRLSGDIAQRVYVIRLVKPKYTPDWDERIERFIKENGPKIHMDILATLQRPPNAGNLVDRWSEWVQGVLRRCSTEPDAVLALQDTRRRGCDEDIEEAQTLLDALRSVDGIEVGCRLHFLTNAQVVGLVNSALNTTKIGTKSALALVRQHIDAGHFDEDGKRAVVDKVRHGNDRGFIVRWANAPDASQQYLSEE